MVVKREKRVHMLFSDDEWSMLQSLADRDGVNVSDWVRRQVRDVHRATFGEERPKKPKR